MADQSKLNLAIASQEIKSLPEKDANDLLQKTVEELGKPLVDPSGENAESLEEFKEARSILFEDLNSEEAAALLNDHNKRKSPVIRRTDNRSTLAEIAAKTKIKRSNYDAQFKAYESYVKDPKSYVEETKDVINNIKEIVSNLKSPVKEVIDLNHLSKKVYSDYDLLVQKVSLLEDAVCSALKDKLKAERNYRLAEAQLNLAYQELYTQPSQKDSNLEKKALEILIDKELSDI